MCLNFLFPEKWVFPSEKLIAQSSSVAANSRESEKKIEAKIYLVSYLNKIAAKKHKVWHGGWSVPSGGRSEFL